MSKERILEIEKEIKKLKKEQEEVFEKIFQPLTKQLWYLEAEKVKLEEDLKQK